MIREATAADLAGVLGLYRFLGVDAPEHYRGERALTPEEAAPLLARISANPDQALLVAVEDGEAVGTVVVIAYPNLTHEGRPAGLIENMVVSPSVRRGGVGRALLDAANDWMRARNVVKVSLTSNQAREGAHRFYEALGWERSHVGYTLAYAPEGRGADPAHA